MRLRRIAALFCSCALGSTLAGRSAGEPRPQARERGADLPAQSVGSPTEGALVGGVELSEGSELRLRWPDGPRWALPDLVSLLGRAARRVHGLFPGSVLLVGDLSRREGGALFGHVSHENGRDADVGFYYADPGGHVVRTERLLPVRPSGMVPAEGHLHFDEPRNWALVESFLTDPRVHVERIFVAEPLRGRLLEFARHHGASEALIARAASALRQPGTGSSHDDHFHVRIACPPPRLGQSEVCVPSPVVMRRSTREPTAALERP